jgi:hypothetical protein
MRLPKTAHTSQPWRVHELTKEFEIEDVWELPTPGGRTTSRDWCSSSPGAARAASSSRVSSARSSPLRWKLGELFGWDKPGSGGGERVRSLRERLPADLLEAPHGPDLSVVRFTSVYQTHDESVAETANMTCHAAMHIGWVPDDSGNDYHAQMTVLVKPNGRFGRVYMAAILPFRRLLVYPPLLRRIGRGWQMQAAG